MSASKAKFTPLPSSEVDGVFKATMPPALQESVFRTVAHYASYPSPLLLLIGMITRVRPHFSANHTTHSHCRTRCWF